MSSSDFEAAYTLNVERRRALCIKGFMGYTDAGLDGPWVTPYQIASRSPDGPVLLTFNYLDAPSALLHVSALRSDGYLPAMIFNRVLTLALAETGLQRADLYVTHAFHLLAPSRSASVPQRAIDTSFDAVARHELEGRRVIALGDVASSACRRFVIEHQALVHPSARGRTTRSKAHELAMALR